LDAALPTFLQVLDRVTGPFLSIGSTVVTVLLVSVGMLAGAFLLNAFLIEPLGWVISGALLFTLSAFALGNRHHVRGLAIGIALSLITFYAFAIGLGVNLPAGILQGIL